MIENEKKALEQGCYYDKEAGERAVRWLETYYIHTTIRKPVTLLPWQRFVISQLFGWKDKKGGSRWQRSLISTAKKNGKDLICAGLIKYALYGNISNAPWIVSCSTSRENASNLYEQLAFSIRFNKKMQKITKLYESKKALKIISKNARYKSLSADASTTEGEYALYTISNETHAQPRDAKLFRAVEGSTISSGGTFINISTAGASQNHFFYELFRYAQKVQSDDIIDPRFFPYICSPPTDADIENPDTWRVANPSLDCNEFFTTENFRDQFNRARNSDTGTFISFQRYHLNMWVLNEANYISASHFDSCKVDELSDEILMQYPMFVGFDGSTTGSDPTSISCVWCLPNRRYYVKSFGYIHEEGVKIRKKENPYLLQYQHFVHDGCFEIMPGQTIDSSKLFDYILKLKRYKFKEFIMDMSNYFVMGQQLRHKGITVFQMNQGHKYFNDPVKQFEMAIKEGRIMHDGKQTWLRNGLINAKLDINSEGLVKLSRAKSHEKIDSAISTVQAFARAMANEIDGSKQSVYSDRGLIFI
mgnify:CR=1 FL=1